MHRSHIAFHIRNLKEMCLDACCIRSKKNLFNELGLVKLETDKIYYDQNLTFKRIT